MPQKPDITDADRKHGKPLAETQDGRTITSDEILKRDLLNVMKKVSQGKPLTGPERELIRAAGHDDGEISTTTDAAKLPKTTKSDAVMRHIIEREADCSERKAYAWLKKLRDKHWSKSGGWRVPDAMAEIDTRRQRSAAGPDWDLKRMKLSLECDILRDRRDRERGDFIPKTDHRARVLAVYGFAVRSIDTWIKTVSAARADAGLKHELEELRRRVYAGLQAEANPDD